MFPADRDQLGGALYADRYSQTGLPERNLGVMTKLSLKGNWNEIKGKLKQKYANLTDDDLLFVEGKEDQVLGRIQQRTGQNKEDLRKEIEAL
jgi:uncharacterized protein YjbJ (UPF0337 family)